MFVLCADRIAECSNVVATSIFINCPQFSAEI